MKKKKFKKGEIYLVIKEKVGENKQSNIRKIKKILLKRPQIERRKRKRNKKNLLSCCCRAAAGDRMLALPCSFFLLWKNHSPVHTFARYYEELTLNSTSRLIIDANLPTFSPPYLLRIPLYYSFGREVWFLPSLYLLLLTSFLFISLLYFFSFFLSFSSLLVFPSGWV